EVAFALIRGVARVPLLNGLVARVLAPPSAGGGRGLGRQLPSRFGLAAGFDKNAVGVAGLTMLGFGFVEVGTVTARAQPGNEAPRLWRGGGQRGGAARSGCHNTR